MASGTIQKKVGELLHLGFRYSSPALASGETLTGVNISATGITVGAGSISGREVTCAVSGGTAGTDYTIRFTVSSSSGQVFIDDYIVKVVA